MNELSSLSLSRHNYGEILAVQTLASELGVTSPDISPLFSAKPSHTLSRKVDGIVGLLDGIS